MTAWLAVAIFAWQLALLGIGYALGRADQQGRVDHERLMDRLEGR